jgi:N-acetylmuramoyl-L-alanine amidase
MRFAAKILLAAAALLAVPANTWAASIVIDAGHGGSNPGAIGVNGLEEKDVNLDIAYALRDELDKIGYETILTRSSDTDMSLEDRVRFTVEHKADLFVSIHSNSYGDPKTRGTMVLYYDDGYPQAKYPASEAMKRLTPQSRVLAQAVLDAVTAATNTENKGLLKSAAYVIRSGEAPSILVETAFLSNKQDAELLAQPAVRQKFAEGIAQGIAVFMPLAGKQEDAPFTDIAGHWAESAIQPLLESGILDGVSATRFAPDQPLTRAQLLAVLDRLFPIAVPAGAPAVGVLAAGVQTMGVQATGLGKADKQGAAGRTDAAVKTTAEQANATGQTNAMAQPGQVSVRQRIPSDLDSGHWAYSVLMRALTAGRIEGYADGTLRPDQPVTRGETAALFYRSLAANGKGKTNAAAPVGAFADVPTTLWSAGAIYALRQLGLAEGVTATSFGPGQWMTRAEIAVLIERYLQSRYLPSGNSAAN